MTYHEFETWLRRAIDAAAPEFRLRLARDAVQRLTRSVALDEVSPADLTPEAFIALASAREGLLTETPEELQRLLDIVDQGVRADGDMDHALLMKLEATDAWIRFCRDGSPDAALRLAILSIERVDWFVSAKLDDFLADSSMRQERDRIAALLAA